MKSGRVRIWYFAVEKLKSGRVHNWNLDMTRFDIFSWQIRIQTRLNLKFDRIFIFTLTNISLDWQNWLGHLVRILIFSLQIKNLDMSGFPFLNGREKNDHNGGIWQSGISESLAEYAQRLVCFVNVQLSLHENVVFSVYACVGNNTYA